MSRKIIIVLVIGLIGPMGLIGRVFSQEKYITGGTPIAEFPMHFTEGYMFVTVPVIDTDVYGKAITLQRSFILDPAASNDGSFYPDDSLTNVTGTRKFYFPISAQRTLTADLVPTLAKEFYKHSDTSFFGALGYAFIKRYITVIDFFNRKVILYSADESNIQWNPGLDTMATAVPYLDDAILDHCHCPFPTMWFEAKSKFLQDGRVHFSLADRQSMIFKQALNPRTQKFFEAKARKDSLEGKKKEPERLDIETFELGGHDIAPRNAHRVIADLPPIFRNLNLFIMGTVAADVLREFPAVIIDPVKQRVLFAK